MRRHRSRSPRQPNRQATRKGNPGRDRANEPPAAAPDALLEPLRQALRDPDPTAFWLTAAPLVTVVEEPGELASALPAGVDLLQTFIDVDIAETTALLHMVAAMGGDELVQARSRRALRDRRQPVPPHVSGLAEAAISETQVFSDVAGDNHLVELTLPGQVWATLVVYVNRSPGPYLKDAFIIAERLDRVAQRFGQLMAGEGIELAEVIRPLDPSQSRAALEQALAGVGPDVAKEPEPEDQWPMCRPLVEFVLSRMPEAGSGYDATGFLAGQRWDQLVARSPEMAGDDPESWLDGEDDFLPWVDEDGTNLVDAFLASAEGDALTQDETTSMVVAQLLTAAAMAEGDPLHWCADVVRGVLEEVLPADPMTSKEALDLVPTVLPALVAWAHARAETPLEESAEARAVMADSLPLLPERCADPRMRAARLEGLIDVALGSGDPTGFARALLIQRVGSVAALEHVPTDPLPTEPLDQRQVPDDLHARLTEIDDALVAGLHALDSATLALGEPVLDAEFRTACRRFLVQVAITGPEVLRRRASSRITAAAVAWLVGRGNHVVGPEPAPVRTRDLLAAFAVQSTPSTRAESLQDAAGLPRSPVGVALASPDLLVAAARRAIIEERDGLAMHQEGP